MVTALWAWAGGFGIRKADDFGFESWAALKECVKQKELFDHFGVWLVAFGVVDLNRKENQADWPVTDFGLLDVQQSFFNYELIERLAYCP